MSPVIGERFRRVCYRVTREFHAQPCDQVDIRRVAHIVATYPLVAFFPGQGERGGGNKVPENVMAERLRTGPHVLFGERTAQTHNLIVLIDVIAGRMNVSCLGMPIKNLSPLQQGIRTPGVVGMEDGDERSTSNPKGLIHSRRLAQVLFIAEVTNSRVLKPPNDFRGLVFGVVIYHDDFKVLESLREHASNGLIEIPTMVPARNTYAHEGCYSHSDPSYWELKGPLDSTNMRKPLAGHAMRHLQQVTSWEGTSDRTPGLSCQLKVCHIHAEQESRLC